MCFSVPGPVLETVVGEDVNSKMLLNLLSGTEYSVQVTASYPTGQSEPLLVNSKTCKQPLLYHISEEPVHICCKIVVMNFDLEINIFLHRNETLFLDWHR